MSENAICEDPRHAWHELGISLRKYPENRLAAYHPIVTERDSLIVTLHLVSNQLQGIRASNGRLVELPLNLLKYCFPGISIRYYRRKHGWTRDQLAELTHLHPLTITKLECDPSMFPGKRAYDAFCEVFGVALEWKSYPIVNKAVTETSGEYMFVKEKLL